MTDFVHDLFRVILANQLFGNMVIAYLVLQVVTLGFLRGNWLILVLVPLPVLFITAWATYVMYLEASNIWPVFFLTILPGAGFYLVIVTGAWVWKRKKGSDTTY